MLAQHLQPGRREAGCDEAGRGPLAGPVTAAAVLLPEDYRNEALDDSKKLTERQREALRPVIEAEADAWAVATVEPEDIDRLNILHAATHAMCLAANALLGKVEKGVVCGGKQLGITAYVNNLFNRLYYASGWRWESYDPSTGQVYTGIGVYPQAPCNFMVKLSLSL